MTRLVKSTKYLFSVLAIYPNLCEVLVESSANEHSSNLRGTGSNLVELGISEKSLGNSLHHVAHTTETLDGVEGNLGGLLGSQENDGSTLLGAVLALVSRLGGLVLEGSGRSKVSVHVGELALQKLVVGNGLAELGSGVDVRKSLVQSSVHETDGAGGKHQSLEIKTRHEHVDSAVELAQNVVLGNENVLEDELSGVGASHTELVELSRAGEASHGLLDKEGGDSSGTGRGISLGVHDEVVGIGTVGDPHLGTVEDVASLDLLGSGLHGDNVGSGTGLGHGQGTNLLTGNQIGEVLFALLRGRVQRQLVDAQLGVSRVRESNGARSSRKLLHDNRVGKVAKVETTVLLRSSHTEETSLAKLLPEVVGERVVDISLLLELRGDFGSAEINGGLSELLNLLDTGSRTVGVGGVGSGSSDGLSGH